MRAVPCLHHFHSSQDKEQDYWEINGKGGRLQQSEKEKFLVDECWEKVAKFGWEKVAKGLLNFWTIHCSACMFLSNCPPVVFSLQCDLPVLYPNPCLKKPVLVCVKTVQDGFTAALSHLLRVTVDTPKAAQKI